MIPGAWLIWTLGAWMAETGCKTLLYSKNISSGPHGLRRYFKSFSHYKSTGATDS